MWNRRNGESSKERGYKEVERDSVDGMVDMEEEEAQEQRYEVKGSEDGIRGVKDVRKEGGGDGDGGQDGG